MIDFAYLIGLLRRKYEFSVTSWYRTEKRNKLVGGKPKSAHLDGRAVDVILDEEKDVPAFCQEAERLGLTVVIEKTHIHIQKGGGHIETPEKVRREQASCGKEVQS